MRRESKEASLILFSVLSFLIPFKSCSQSPSLSMTSQRGLKEGTFWQRRLCFKTRFESKSWERSLIVEKKRAHFHSSLDFEDSCHSQLTSVDQFQWKQSLNQRVLMIPLKKELLLHDLSKKLSFSKYKWILERPNKETRKEVCLNKWRL